MFPQKMFGLLSCPLFLVNSDRLPLAVCVPIRTGADWGTVLCKLTADQALFSPCLLLFFLLYVGLFQAPILTPRPPHAPHKSLSSTA